MRTRTLLILAVVCGLAILLAGGIKLLSVADDGGAGSEDLQIGASTTAGDADVTVLAAAEADGRMVVHVRIGGVDDPDGFDGFALVVAGAALRAEPDGDGGSTCAGFTDAVQTCDLVFDTSEITGTPRVLLLRRGEDQRRWSLV